MLVIEFTSIRVKEGAYIFCYRHGLVFCALALLCIGCLLRVRLPLDPLTHSRGACSTRCPYSRAAGRV
jgi:hypothetical protein